MSLQVGAHIYARATVLIFIIVTTVLVSVFVSFFVAAPLEVTESSVWNATGHGTANYFGFRRRTLEGLFRLFDGAGVMFKAGPESWRAPTCRVRCSTETHACYLLLDSDQC